MHHRRSLPSLVLCCTETLALRFPPQGYLSVLCLCTHPKVQILSLLSLLLLGFILFAAQKWQGRQAGSKCSCKGCSVLLRERASAPVPDACFPSLLVEKYVNGCQGKFFSSPLSSLPPISPPSSLSLCHLFKVHYL